MFRKICLLLIGLVFLLGCNMLTPGSAPTPTAEASPSPVAPKPTLKPTVSPAPTQELTFDLNNLNQVPPKDIIAEIAYFGLPGGGGIHPCMGEYKKPTLEAPSEVEILQKFNVAVCAAPVGDIKVSIKKPDGTVTETVSQPWDGLDYMVDITQPIGQYQFRLTGNGWEFFTTVEVREASEPRLYLDYDKMQIIFYHYQPNEKVRLFAYAPAAFSNSNYGMSGLALKGWKEYQMDAKGQQIISVGADAMRFDDFVSVGEVSGQVPKDWQYSYQYKNFAIACGSGVKPIGLRPGDFVQVIVGEITLVLVDTWETVRTVKKGDILQVTAGPVCHDNSFYWRVNCINASCEGDVKESDVGIPLVQVIKELPPTPTPDLSQIPACPGAKATRLKPGIQARVSQAAAQLNLRDAPRSTANKIHVIVSGRLMNILAELPVCADNAYWWHVYVPEKGFGGWAREGDNEDYWIDPLP